MFTLTIRTDNAAFEAYAWVEVARLLRDVADKVENGFATGGKVRDLNGNTVGEWALTSEGS